MRLSLRKAAYVAVGNRRVAGNPGRTKRKVGFRPLISPCFSASAKGEARGQIRLLLKNTPISDEIQRFGAAFLLVIGLTTTPLYDSDTSIGSSYL
jgi:hypothetical protein